MIAGQPYINQRRQRIHDRDEIRRPETGLDKLDKRSREPHRVALANVIVVEEKCKNA